MRSLSSLADIKVENLIGGATVTGDTACITNVSFSAIIVAVDADSSGAGFSAGVTVVGDSDGGGNDVKSTRSDREAANTATREEKGDGKDPVDDDRLDVEDIFMNGVVGDTEVEQDGNQEVGSANDVRDEHDANDDADDDADDKEEWV